MKLLIMQSSPASPYLVLLMSKSILLNTLFPDTLNLCGETKMLILDSLLPHRDSNSYPQYSVHTALQVRLSNVSDHRFKECIPRDYYYSWVVIIYGLC
jgi:hypothetical protein